MPRLCRRPGQFGYGPPGKINYKRTTAEKQGFEAGLLLVLRCVKYKFTKRFHDSYVKKLQRRKIKMRTVKELDGCQPLDFPQSTSPRLTKAEWLRQELHRCGYDTRKPAKQLLLAASAVSKGSSFVCSIGCERQLMLWLGLLESSKLTVKPFAGGLGLFACESKHGEPATAFAPGTVVARGVLDDQLWWPELKTLAESSDKKHAALFGPISLINAACCAACSNVEFERVAASGEYRAIACGKNGVRTGEQVLCKYSQLPGKREKCTCPVCGRTFY
jgi:hypothetical protein